MKPDASNKTFGIANKHLLISLVVLLVIGIPAFGVVSMITADTSNIGNVLTVTYSGTDTTTIQNYFNTAGISEIVLNGDMTIGTITVPSTIHKISGTATIRQASLSSPGFIINGVNNVTIEGLTLVGIDGNASASSNEAIRVKNSSFIYIRNNYISGWRNRAVWLSNTTNFEIIGNQIVNNSHGVRGDHVKQGKINGNTFNQSQYQNFSTAVGLMERTAADCLSCGSGGNVDIQVHDNQFYNWWNSQGVLAHDCTRCSMENNDMNLVGWGYSFSGNAADDVIQDSTIKNNYWRSTQEIGATANFDGGGNQCVTVDGSLQAKNSSNITISGNTCVDGNKIKQIWNSGTIIIRNANDTTVSENHIVNPYSVGVFLYGYSWNISISNNHIQNVTSVPSSSGIGIYSYTGIQSGIISGNTIQNTFDGIEYDTTSPDLWIVFNVIQARSAAIHTVGTVGKKTHNAGDDI